MRPRGPPRAARARGPGRFADAWFASPFFARRWLPELRELPVAPSVVRPAERSARHVPGNPVHPRGGLEAQAVARRRQPGRLLSAFRNHKTSGHPMLNVAALPRARFAHLRGGNGRDYISAPRPSGGMADATDSKSVGGNPMRVRLSPRASVMLLLIPLLYAQLATAQHSSLRGTVVSAESGEPLGFTIVSLRPNGGRQFTDSAGAFAFTATAAGSYVLSVRQIGYTPLDTQIVVRGDSTTVVRVALRHLAIELPPVTIAGTQCTSPGRPDSSDAALFAVFDQLQENARRFELLVDSYPFHYDLELSLREVSQRGDTGRPAIRRLRFESTDTHPYAVGRVVEPGWGPWGSPDNVLVIRSADLEDLGNEDFIANHCFHLAGR